MRRVLAAAACESRVPADDTTAGTGTAAALVVSPPNR